MEPFKLFILAEDKNFFEGDCLSLSFPTVDGEYGVLAHHSNVVASVQPGTLRFTLPDGTARVAAVSYGMVKVEDGEVLVLVGSAERPEEIDEARARRKYEEAQEALLQKKSVMEYRSAQAKLARAASRLRTKREYANLK